MRKSLRQWPSKMAARRGSAIGGQLFMCVLVGGALGYGVDKLLHWNHWGLIAGILLGFTAWIWELWKMMGPK